MSKETYVSRSVYQKQVEYNKKLLADIRVFVCGSIADRIFLKQKWAETFRAECELNTVIKTVVKKMADDIR